MGKCAGCVGTGEKADLENTWFWGAAGGSQTQGKSSYYPAGVRFASQQKGPKLKNARGWLLVWALRKTLDL